MKQFKGYTKGINLGGWLSQCRHSSSHYESFITEKDIADIAAMGLDHVRLPVDYEAIEDENGSPLSEGYCYIDKCAEWCEAHGLNLVLDLHKTAGFVFDDAQSSTLFSSRENMQRFLQLWNRLSARYDSNPRIAFELLNEVVEDDPEKWNDLIAQAIRVIRRNAPETCIIIGGVQWNSVHTLKLLRKPTDKNIVFNFHFYEPFLFTHQCAPWQPIIPKMIMNYPSDIREYRNRSQQINCFGSGLYNVDKMGAGFMRALISEAVEAAENAGVPLYCGEYGVDWYAPARDTLEWFRDIHSVFEEYGIGRAAWTYKGMDFGLIELHYRSVISELTKLL